MGMDIYIIREAFVDGKWQCCEKSYGEYLEQREYDYEFESKIRKESSGDADYGRCSQLFGLLTGDAYMTAHPMFDCSNGVPEDVSDMTRMRIEDEDKRTEDFLNRNNLPISFNNKNHYYNCTFKEIENFMDKWREDMVDTGQFAYEFIDEEGMSKLERFEDGIYKNDVNKHMELMCKIFDDVEFNVMRRFLKFLDDEQCGEKFKGDLKSITSDKKRIIFWLSW